VRLVVAEDDDDRLLVDHENTALYWLQPRRSRRSAILAHISDRLGGHRHQAYVLTFRAAAMIAADTKGGRCGLFTSLARNEYGAALWDAVCEHELEGEVAKRRSGCYLSARRSE
jgi:hypothetical protein